MIIVMQPHAGEEDVRRVVATIRQQGLSEHVSRGTECTIIGAVGDERVFDVAQIEALPGVERAIRIVQEWRIISREAWAEDTQITVRGIRFGGQSGVRHIQFIAPNEADAAVLPQSQAVLLDPFHVPANPYAPKSSLHPEDTLHRYHQICRQQSALLMVRIRDSAHITAALDHKADMLYLGGEVLANRRLLQEIGSLNIPAVVCKAAHHSVRDWLVAAEQVVLQGNRHIILGDAGTLSWHSEHLRLDIDALVAAKKLSHLPTSAVWRTATWTRTPYARWPAPPVWTR